MKGLISLIFIIFSCTCAAQNYQCLQYGPVNFFLNGNGYIRGIRIDSIHASGSDTVFYPYHSYRGTYYSCWTGMYSSETVGASWLGKNVIKQADGTFLFDNMWNDTVIIRTQAHLGDSWLFFNDTTYESYKATVIGIDTMTISGIVDSIKKISIEADSGSIVNTLDPVNGFQIILSKNNGFVQVFDLYTFPYHRPDTIYQYREFFDYNLDRLLGNLGIGDLTCFWDPLNPPDTLNSVFHLFSWHDPTGMEIYDFSVGDVFEYKDFSDLGGSGYHSVTVVDTVISKVSTPYYVAYQISEHQNIDDFYGSTHAYSASHDTIAVTADSSRLFHFNLMPEEVGSPGFYYYFHDSTILSAGPGTSSCSADIYSTGSVTLEYDGFVATYPAYSTFSYGIGYGQTGLISQNYTSYNMREKKYLYANKSGSICGTFYRVDLGVSNVSAPDNVIKMFPNPASDILYITSATRINQVSIGNIMGQVYYSGNCDQDNLQIDVSFLPSGVYFVKINGETRKLVKE